MDTFWEVILYLNYGKLKHGAQALAGWQASALLTDLMCFVYVIYLTNKKVVLN